MRITITVDVEDKDVKKFLDLVTPQPTVLTDQTEKWTVEEAAKELGVSTKTVRTSYRNGKLKGYEAGRKMFIYKKQ